MGWFDKWFDETSWPKEPRLDEFRGAVWELSLDDEMSGWLATWVTPMRSFPFLWIKQESMWTQMHWIDGTHERPEEDYAPEWYAVEELLNGRFVINDPRTGDDVSYRATPVTDTDRDRLWALLYPGSAHG